MSQPLTLDEFCSVACVSRETRERLELYGATLEKWQKRLNLVGPSTLTDMWRRHFLDSAQLMPLIPSDAKVLLDLGSGAGFPGLVLAVLGVPQVHLVESDQRKCAFLREVARLMDVSVTIHASRFEALAPFPVDVLSARAVAPVGQLLEMAESFLGSKTVCLFPKGQNVGIELTDARKIWMMQVETFSSQTHPEGTLLRLTEVRREY